MTETAKITTQNERRSALEKFFEGRLYPFLIAAAVLFGHITALEFYVAIPMLIFASVAFLVCRTVKPFIPLALSFVYLVNIEHAPGVPTWSDYYKSTYIILTAIALFTLLLGCAIYFAAKNIVPKFKIRSAPLLFPLLLLSAAFLLNGAFSGRWNIASLAYGAAQAAVFFLCFYLFYYGLKGEDTKKLLDYISYVALLVGMVIVIELANMFMTSDVIINKWGVIVKDNINLGWGISNPIGFSLIILIPLLMRGAIVSRARIVYLLAPLIVSFAAFITLSRNAILFGALTLLATFIIALVKSKSRWPYITVVITGAVLGGAILFKYLEDIKWILHELMLSGVRDSGRFKNWNACIENFKLSPLFGIGFFSWGEIDHFSAANFLPNMAHNTVFQLLSSMGIVGLVSYAIYRICSLVPFMKKLTFDKIMVLLPILITIGTSLLDNFMFYFYTTFIYEIMLAIAFNIRDKEKEYENL